MMKYYVLNALIIIVTIFTGCTTIAKESVELSVELTKMIRSAERSHLSMLDLYITERKRRVNEFIDSTWTPAFMSKTIAGTHILDLLKEQNNDEQKTQILKEFSEDAASTISQRRAKMIDAIDKIDKMIRTRIKQHYDDMITVNQMLTVHIRSVSDANETRVRILESLNVDPRSVLPLDKISSVLDKVTNYEGKVEEMGEYIEQANIILKEGK